jgi:hypothetical protein
MNKLLIGLWLAVAAGAQTPTVYHLLWFDTEDYIEPLADDAALRLARELEQLGIRATFKVVGEKARVLEQRGRRDVIEALKRHDIGYHSNNHSIPPTPAVYLQPLGLLEGAAEFERREGPGHRDVERIFGMKSSCYGQPGNSWGPQANLALRRMGIRVYMDEARQVGLEQQPFWYGGLLYVFNLQQFSVRADINDEAKLPDAKRKFDEGVAALRARGGGVMQTYYHPTEFVTTEFWDGVNFRHGANPPRDRWVKPKLRTAESREQAHRIFLDFMRHVRGTPGVKIVTARELPDLMAPPTQSITVADARRLLRQSVSLHNGHSAADLLVAALGLSPRYVDGPSAPGKSTWMQKVVWREGWETAKRDAISFIETHQRLPAEVWLGSERLALEDFAATLAWDEDNRANPPTKFAGGELSRHIATDAARSYNWVIHPPGFAPQELLDLARLQAWTLKPARLKQP